MKTSEKNRGRFSEERVIFILILILCAHIGIRILAAPHKAPVKVYTETQPALSARIDLNSATVDELAMLPGIGPVKARQITDYREEHGDFTSIDELLNIKGFGRKTIDEIAGMLQVIK